MGMSSKIKEMMMFRRRSSSSNNAMIKLIKSDGVVTIYSRPIKARQLMEEFPKHMICRSDSFYIGQKTEALSRNHRLQPGHDYFLLPANFFQSALSFSSFLRCPRSSSSLPFQVEKTPSGTLRIKMLITTTGQEENADQHHEMINNVICTTPQLRKEYEQLVRRRHRWKPKLDTIAETTKKTTKFIVY